MSSVVTPRSTSHPFGRAELLLGAFLLMGCQPVSPDATPDVPRASIKSLTTLERGPRPPEPSADLPVSRIRFVDRTQTSGIRCSYRNDSEHSDFSILESLGGGAGILDYDHDGQLDVFLTGGGRFENTTISGNPSSLFRNRGNWSFHDVSDSARCDVSLHYSHGVAAADYNEDGFDDLIVTGYGGVMLYENQGDGTFHDVTAAARVTDSRWSSSAAWGDLNGDGALDLFVAHYVDWSWNKHPLCSGPNEHPRDVCPPKDFLGLRDAVFYSNGDATFRDATDEAGLLPEGKGLGVVLADLDVDGDLDVYVTNDTVGNFLYLNNGQGQLDDHSLISGASLSDVGTPDGSMGVDVGDYNGDGLPDIFVTNYEREKSALYRNLGSGQFRHMSQSVGIAAIGATYVSWGTRFIDADLDGDEDLVIANGHVIRYPVNSPPLQHALVLENDEGKKFRNASGSAGDYFQSGHSGRGLATGDLDGDGDEDLVISNVNEPAVILSNESNSLTADNSRNPTSHPRWLAIQLAGTHSCRTSIGAVVSLTRLHKTLTRRVRGGSSYASSSDRTLYFGCGDESHIREINIKWLNGATVSLQNVETNQVLLVHENGQTTPLNSP